MAILVGGFFGFLILIVAFIGIVSMFDKTPVPGNVLEPMLASQTMPDGSQLILKAATLGTTHEHTQPYPRRENSMFNASPEEARMELHLTFSEEQLGLWFEQFYQPSLQPDDLTWWTRTSVLDERGHEVFDSQSARFVASQYGCSSEVGFRPYSPADRNSEPQIIAGLALFPMFRNSNDTLTVRIYGADSKPVAEFEIPNPMKAKSFPVWTPEPFPISKTISGVTITLEDVQYFRKKWTSDAGAESYEFRLKPSYTVTEMGELIQDGIIDPYQVSDALGHQGGNYNPGLPLDEAAWKLSIPWRRNPRTVTDPGSMVLSSSLEQLPPDAAPFLLSESLRCRTSKVSMLAMGAGTYEFRNLVSGTGTQGRISNIEPFAGSNHVVSYSRNDRNSNLKIESDLSWLVTQIESSPSEK
ncbi:MAG TPA: hypothetical protein VMM56_17645 [Planctomycetaceae bacterium]|nr:hypothetical protein [Planctomycetaceae bacterium]